MSPARYGHRYRLIVALALLTVLACTGGASRADEDQQMIARLASVIAIAASLWPLETGPLDRHRRLIAAVGAAYALLIAQLVPLSPGVWAALPGHGPYAEIARESGTLVWRPLSLTPDLTADALGALLPATAAGLACLYLDGRGRRLLFQWLIILAALGAILGLIQLAAGGTAFHFYRESSESAPVGFFANRNHQAVLLACCLPPIGALLAARLRQLRDPRFILAGTAMLVTLLLLVLALTGSRMGLVLVAVGLAGGGWCYRANGGISPPLRRAWLLLATAALVVAGLVIAAARHGGALERFAATDATGEARAQILHPLLETAAAFLPFGAGFGAFDSVYRRFEPDALLSTVYMNQAHDEPIQLAIEGGVPALLLLALFLWWWSARAISLVRGRGDAGRRGLGLSAMSASVILMLSSLVDYPLRTPLLGAVFAIAIVTMMRAAEPEPRIRHLSADC